MSCAKAKHGIHNATVHGAKRGSYFYRGASAVSRDLNESSELLLIDRCQVLEGEPIWPESFQEPLNRAPGLDSHLLLLGVHIH
jgi:hypothetical protein